MAVVSPCLSISQACLGIVFLQAMYDKPRYRHGLLQKFTQSPPADLLDHNREWDEAFSP